MAARRHHDRVDNDKGRLVLAQLAGNDADRLGNADHADFHSVYLYIFKYSIDLRCDHLRRHVHISPHALRVLRYDSRDDVHSITAVGAKGLAVRRRSGPAGWIRSGNRYYVFHRLYLPIIIYHFFISFAAFGLIYRSSDAVPPLLSKGS